MVMYPVLSYWGTHLGYVQRHYKALNDWWSGAKAMNIVQETHTPFLHFPLLTHEKFDGTLCVVEDIPSAEVIRHIIPSCALLGTNIGQSEIKLFTEIGVRHLVVCLDNDAIGTSIGIKRKLELIFDRVTVLFPDKDPKDMDQNELIDLLGGI